MNKLQLGFDYEQTILRTLTDETGIWFVLKDVCDCLNYTNSRVIYDKVKEDEKKKSSISTSRGVQELQLVNESGLYRIIFSSKSEKADEFRKWVISDVLPVIKRQQCYYLISNEQLVEFLTERCRQDAEFLKTFNKNTIRTQLNRERKEEAERKSAILYLNRDKYTKEEYKAKLYEIWGEDYDNARKQYHFYLGD